VLGREQLEKARDAMRQRDEGAGHNLGLGKPRPCPQALQVAHLDFIQATVQNRQIVISFANSMFHCYSPGASGVKP
jgi:hypothetical protein